MPDVTRRCLFCDHPIQFIGPPNARRWFCFDCLPAFSKNGKREYHATYNLLRSACCPGAQPIVATSCKIPHGHPARKQAEARPPSEKLCDDCGEAMQGRARFCSARCKRNHMKSRASVTSVDRAELPPVVVVVPSGCPPTTPTRSKRNARAIIETLPVVGVCHYCSGPLSEWWTVYRDTKRQRRCYQCHLAAMRLRQRKRATTESSPVDVHHPYAGQGAVVLCQCCGSEFKRGSNRLRYCSPDCKALAQRDVDRRQNNKRRGAPVGQRYTLREVFDRDGGVCHLCGEAVDITQSGSIPTGPTIDHVLPLSLGGIDCITNVALAHRSCNITRQAKPLEAAWASLT